MLEQSGVCLIGKERRVLAQLLEPRQQVGHRRSCQHHKLIAAVSYDVVGLENITPNFISSNVNKRAGYTVVAAAHTFAEERPNTTLAHNMNTTKISCPTTVSHAHKVAAIKTSCARSRATRGTMPTAEARKAASAAAYAFLAGR